MKDDDRLVPVVRRGSELAKQLDRTRRAMDVRDPITGFFHALGSKAATKALDHNTAEHQALKRNFDAQSDVVGAIIDFRNTVDAYEARHELAGEYKKLAVDRARLELAEQRTALHAKMATTQGNAFEAQRIMQEKRNWRDHVRTHKEINAQIQLAQKAGKFEQWAAPPEERAPQDFLWAEYDRLTTEIQANRADGKDVSGKLRDLAEIQTILARRKETK